MLRFLQPQESAPDGQAVEPLVQRVNESVLLNDRRDALFQLRDLIADNSKAQRSFGSVGFPTLCKILRELRTEDDMVRAALEAMSHAVNQDGRATPQEAQIAAVNAEQLARTPDSITLLLSLLDDDVGVKDFYSRYHTIQILKALLTASTSRLQEAVLGFPLGVVRLIGMLEEQEVIRNEAVLLLQHLAAGNAEIQKILAFEGAFDKLFAIVREEGGMEGGIVVQDCMALLVTLLKNSVANQLMFRELGYLSEIPMVLQMKPPKQDEGLGGLMSGMSDDRQGNFLAVLRVIEVLLLPANEGDKTQTTARDQNAAVLLQHGLLPTLLSLGLNVDAMPNPVVRGQALVCLSLLAFNQINKDMLNASIATTHGGSSLPFLHAVLRVAINGEDYHEHNAADRVLAAMCDSNPGLQYSVANSLQPGGVNTIGNELLQGILREGSIADLLASSRAAAQLSHIVNNNLELKQKLLSMQIPGHTGGILAVCAQRLASGVMKYGTTKEGCQMIVNYAALLLLWVRNFPPAVEAFLASVRQTPFLVGAILTDKQFGDGAAVIKGTCAVLLGLVTKYVPPGAATPKEALTNAIQTQIGVGSYRNIMAQFQQKYGPSAPKSAEPSLSSSVKKQLPALVNEISAEWGGPPVALHPAGPANPPAVASGVAQPNGPSSSHAIAGGGNSLHGSRVTSPTGVVSPTHATTAFNKPLDVNSTSSQYAVPQLAAQPPSFLPQQNQYQQQHPPSVVSSHHPTSPGRGPAPAAPTFGAHHTTHQLPQYAPPQPVSFAPPQQDSYDASELHLLKEENGRLQEELAELKKQLTAARNEAQSARETANRFEAELEGLSTAYAELDGHASELQAQVQGMSIDSKPAVVTSNGISEEEVQARIQAAVEEAQQDGDAAMEDLLICLGQEEAKVAALSEKLESVGLSAAQVLESLFENAEDE